MAPDTAGVVKLIVDPVQTGVLLDAVGVAGTAFTTMVIAFEVAGFPVTPERFEVITQVITFPFARDDEVYVELVAPEIFVPFNFH